MAVKRRDLYGPVLHLARGPRPAPAPKADRRDPLAITGGPGGPGAMAGERPEVAGRVSRGCVSHPGGSCR